MLNRLNHVAIAVPDLKKAAAFYRDVLGAKVSEPQDVAGHGVTSVFVELSNIKLELLTPLGETSPIAKYLEKNPQGGLHHLCFEVQDIHASKRVVEGAGVRVLNPPKPGAHGESVIFMHPKDTFGCLLELEEGQS
ncbi:MAG: methylmalonyl-CoA epimerase [Alphaproteobacteria bacterium]|jgi:methylmalonyl-CoA/ethylmalonyl-CoA epimerase|nr:methylmalonyl-CoA epimerase [Alphaproteobacteria bacterium]